MFVSTHNFTAMSNDNHTKEFERIMTEGFKQPKEVSLTKAILFVMKMSKGLVEEVTAKIVAKTGHSYVKNTEIYQYCVENGIETDVDPYDNYSQPELDFEEPVDYSTFNPLDDVKIDGKTGFVLANDTTQKKLTVEFDDDTIKTINYGE